MQVTPAIRLAAKEMLDEFDSMGLEVGKFPCGHDQGYLRLVLMRNAEWYRKFCRLHEQYRRQRKYRKPRTIIKRCWTRKALLHLIEGKNHTLYSARLIDFIARRQADLEASDAAD